MNKRMRIIAVAVLLLSIGLTLALQQIGIVSADDIMVTITGPEGPTNQSPIELTITFTAPVTGFELADITVTPPTTVTNLDDTGAPVYTVDLNLVDEGVVTVDIAEGVVEESNQAADGYSIVYDVTPPQVSIESINPDPTGQGFITYIISFDEEINDFAESIDDFVANVVITNGNLGPFTPHNTTQEIDLAVLAQDFADVTIQIPAGIFFDLAGNSNEVAEKTITYVDQPWVVVEKANAQKDPTHIPEILFDVIFNEAVTGFEAADVDLTASDDTLGEMDVDVTGAEDRYTITVSGMTGPGKVVVDIPAGAAEDVDENESLASINVDNEVTFEGPVPEVVNIERVQDNPTKAESVNFYVTFSEVVHNVEVKDFVLTTTGDIEGAAVQVVVGTGDQRFVSVQTGTGNGTMRLDVAPDAEILDDDGFPMIDLPYVDGEVYDVRIESFVDVDIMHWAWQWIEKLYDNGVTTGCGQDPLSFCPDADVTRAEMAKFILAAMHAADVDLYAPPELVDGDETGFEDVAWNYWAGAWIKVLSDEGLTNGCFQDNDNVWYCPEDKVTRAEMAKFILSALHGDEPGYPLPALVEGDQTGFEDVTWDFWAAAWIKQLGDEDLTNGCNQQDGKVWYCPDLNVTRAEMAKFLVEAFNLP